MDQSSWKILAEYIKQKIIHFLDPESPNLLVLKSDDFMIAHKGFYIGILDASEKELTREGFLKDGQTSLLESVELALQKTFEACKAKKISKEKIHTSSFHLTIVTDCVYLPDPVLWNEKQDGVYFMWGQNYSGFYLPYQIIRKNINKIEVLDQLCSWECKLPSNLWKMPEGLIFKLVCHSFQL